MTCKQKIASAKFENICLVHFWEFLPLQTNYLKFFISCCLLAALHSQRRIRGFFNNNNVYFASDSWSISQGYSNNTITQKWLVIGSVHKKG